MTSVRKKLLLSSLQAFKFSGRRSDSLTVVMRVKFERNPSKSQPVVVVRVSSSSSLTAQCAHRSTTFATTTMAGVPTDEGKMLEEARNIVKIQVQQMKRFLVS